MPQISLAAVVLVILTPLLWAAGIIVMRLVSVPSPTMPFFVVVGSLIPCLAFTLFYLPVFGTPTMRQSGIALVAGILNGLGLILFWAGLVGGSSRGLWDLSTVGPVTYALLPCLLAGGSWLILGEGFSTNKVLGITFAMAAIVLLGR